MLIALCCRWIASRISKILDNEDDVIIELCFNLLEGSRYVCPDRASAVVVASVADIYPPTNSPISKRFKFS